MNGPAPQPGPPGTYCNHAVQPRADIPAAETVEGSREGQRSQFREPAARQIKRGAADSAAGEAVEGAGGAPRRSARVASDGKAPGPEGVRRARMSLISAARTPAKSLGGGSFVGGNCGGGVIALTCRGGAGHSPARRTSLHPAAP